MVGYAVVVLWLVALTVLVQVISQDLARDDVEALRIEMRALKATVAQQADELKGYQAEANDAIAAINARSGAWANEVPAKPEVKVSAPTKKKKPCPKCK